MEKVEYYFREISKIPRGYLQWKKQFVIMWKTLQKKEI